MGSKTTVQLVNKNFNFVITDQRINELVPTTGYVSDHGQGRTETPSGPKAKTLNGPPSQDYRHLS